MVVNAGHFARLLAVAAGIATLVLTLVAIISTPTNELTLIGWGAFSAGIGLLALAASGPYPIR